MKRLFVSVLLVWYVVFFLIMGINPVDAQNWVFANVLPVLFVGVLTVTYYRLSFSCLSYVMFSTFLTLHTIGAHYTYAQVPVGDYVENIFELPRNHFDRVVHFCFGLLMAYPLDELIGKMKEISVWIRSYMVFMTLVGLAGIWEILESWLARVVRPGLGHAFLGSQGDIWDAQNDMAATVYGVAISLSFMLVIWKIKKSHHFRYQERLV